MILLLQRSKAVHEQKHSLFRESVVAQRTLFILMMISHRSVMIFSFNMMIINVVLVLLLVRWWSDHNRALGFGHQNKPSLPSFSNLSQLAFPHLYHIRHFSLLLLLLNIFSLSLLFVLLSILLYMLYEKGKGNAILGFIYTEDKCKRLE